MSGVARGEGWLINNWIYNEERDNIIVAGAAGG